MSGDGLDAALAEAVHGGPQLAASRLAAWLRARGIACPAQVVAIQDLGTRRLPARWRRIELHHGLVYAFAPATATLTRLDEALRRSGALRGEAVRCSRPSELVQSIRLAILALRRHELADLAVDVSPRSANACRPNSPTRTTSPSSRRRCAGRGVSCVRRSPSP